MPFHNVPNKGQRPFVFEARFVSVGLNLVAFGLAQSGNPFLRESRRYLCRSARGNDTRKDSYSYVLDHGRFVAAFFWPAKLPD